MLVTFCVCPLDVLPKEKKNTTDTTLEEKKDFEMN